MAFLPKRRDNWALDPFSELEHLQREMNRMFDLSLAKTPWGETTLLGGQWAPAVDIFDSKDTYLVHVDLPGLKKEEMDVSVEDNQLIIKGEKKKEEEVKEENYCKTERFYGSFYRSIPLPAAVESSKVQARYQDGVLTLTLPKKEEVKPRQIKVDIR